MGLFNHDNGEQQLSNNMQQLNVNEQQSRDQQGEGWSNGKKAAVAGGALAGIAALGVGAYELKKHHDEKEQQQGQENQPPSYNNNNNQQTFNSDGECL
jgi:hypothetical protein